MRTIIAATLALVGAGVLATAPANAAAKWTCVGPEYVCGAAPQAVYKAKPAASQYKPAQKATQYKPAKAKKAVASYDNSYSAPSKPKKKATTSYSDSGSYTLTGKASFYWQPQPVASGGQFNPWAMTAAHKTLPFGTKVRVTNQNNGQSVVVTINDRGPYIAGRIIDLSKGAAHKIIMQDAGVVPVKVAVLGKG